MTYELALKLKKAGFPEREQGYADAFSGPNVVEIPIDGVVTRIYIPTLSELIEACGDEFATLSKVNTHTTRWAAQADYLEAERVFADTPEEAVASLWLALQEKS